MRKKNDPRKNLDYGDELVRRTFDRPRPPRPKWVCRRCEKWYYGTVDDGKNTLPCTREAPGRQHQWRRVEG